MPRPLRFLLLPILVLFTASCGEPTRSEPTYRINIAQATVTVHADTVVATRQIINAHECVSLEFPVTITNTGADTLRTFSCSTGLEEKRDGVWRYSGGGGCFLILPVPGDTIPPGETLEFVARVSVVSSVAPFSGTFPGEYRYRVGLTWTGLDGTIPNSRSNTFVVVFDE